MAEEKVDADFTKRLPKVELHAHLTGSISVATLHEIWVQRRSEDAGFSLEDPSTALPADKVDYDVYAFFPLFDKYIYELLTTPATVHAATLSVLRDFHADGVRYLELRTTPRSSPQMTGALYVATVVGALSSFAASQAHLPDRDRMHVSLLLSVDRARHDARAAEEIVDLALAHRQQRYRNDGGDGIDGGPVVGLDLCGNPLRGDVSVFAAAFARAKAEGLGVSLHFAEVPPLATTTTSSTSPSPAQPAAGELETLLSFEPDRLGHVIHVPENLQREIARRRIGLELCLSCNVHARLTSGGFADHHFGYWRDKGCPISLCTDDVGVFRSPSSNEYLLAADHFDLTRADLVQLSAGAISSIFAGRAEKDRLLRLLGEFAAAEQLAADIGNGRAKH